MGRRATERLVVGLISGTSVDGIEAVVCRVRGTGPNVELQLLSHVSVPFAPAFVNRVIEVSTPHQVCELNFALGEKFARAALLAIEVAKLKPKQIDAIGSHGQTIAHLPGSTLQLGEASVIAERTGIGVVSDFRTRDVAAGGHGAPLVPYFDWVMFRRKGRVRALQNIGGISNVSVVGDRLGDTLAFDNGPGNMVIDALVRRATRFTRAFDKDGAIAARGTVISRLLSELCRLPYFKQRPPRSFGREQFGDDLADSLWRRYGQRPDDLIATATAFTIETIAQSYERFVLPKLSLEAIYLSGGGRRNPMLFHGLEHRLHPIPVRPLDVLGFPEGAKEAACFALLAAEHLNGTPQNVPSATGARRRVLLGKWVPA